MKSLNNNVVLYKAEKLAKEEFLPLVQRRKISDVYRVVY